MALPVIGITIGDPAGIGPEIVVRAVADPIVQQSVRPVVIGDGTQNGEIPGGIVTHLSTNCVRWS